MNRDRIEGNWKQLKGRVIEQWYSLSGNRGGMLAGRREQIAGRMQSGYGLIAERSAQQLSEWRRFMRYQRPLRDERFNLSVTPIRAAHAAAAKVVCEIDTRLRLVRS